MSAAAIVLDILMFPTVIFGEIKNGSYIAPAVGLGAGIYFVGMPSADMDFYQLAQWYLTTGAAVVAAKEILPAKTAFVADSAIY